MGVLMDIAVCHEAELQLYVFENDEKALSPHILPTCVYSKSAHRNMYQRRPLASRVEVNELRLVWRRMEGKGGSRR